ncbi:MAG: hypothetical protein ABJG88_03780 [Litorimonas sp.]
MRLITQIMAGTAIIALAACSDKAAETVEKATDVTAAKSAAKTAAKAAAVVDVTSIDSVLAHPRRADEAKRDAYRHPKETLEFFEVGPGKNVAEVWPGWYANAIAPYMAANGGTYTAILYPAALGERFVKRNAAFKEKYGDTSVYGDIQYGEYFSTVDDMVAPESLDVVMTFRNVHNWLGRDYGDHAFQTFYKSLKPGGILGVVEHRLPESATQNPKGNTGYVQESFMKDMAIRAGFEFVASSEINANPQDTADHPYGVWTLPPASRTPDEGSEEAKGFDAKKFEAIGESDRATLKFRKPL